jgi:type I restriction enzyme R subunit
LHAYTITHAIEDRNVLKFHIDYFKGQGDQNPDEAIEQRAVAEAIIDKHNAATNQRKFNAVLATASINNAIEYYRLFKELQKKKQTNNPDYIPLNITAVFSPPAQLIAKEGDQQTLNNCKRI